jgi:Fe-S-cluster containining protein
MSEENIASVGRFSFWLSQLIQAQVEESQTDVPCGSCTACCQSYQFIHIRPTEKQTLEVIPKGLLFPAPGLPAGHVLMGYDEQGRCPMLIEGRCSIYEQRPITCRIYDCRIFPATGLVPNDDRKGLISEQVTRWQFDILDSDDREQQRAVQAAAKFLCEKENQFPPQILPRNMTQLAVLAIKIHQLFLQEWSRSCSDEKRIDEIISLLQR